MTAMEENFVGYLLGALDAESEREVEAYLRGQPESSKKLELLRQALQPLSADREAPVPPSGLRIRTLARVAEYRCRDLPRAPVAPPIRSRAPVRSWWRRTDLLVAASLLLLLLPLLPPTLTHLRAQRDIVECQDNLRHFYTALMAYSERHRGALPKVEAEPPRHVAGIFVPILYDANLLQGNFTVECPANGRRPPPAISVQDLEREYQAGQERFKDCARRLAGCYAYTLGYRDAGQLCGLSFDQGQPNNNSLPIMADRPPFEQDNPSSWRLPPGNNLKNSLNHGGIGQNVLYLSGRVRFCTKRTVGVDGDDIYLNKDNLPEAGIDRWDSVLGASGFHPNLPLLGGD
jgi:hypothetical protein